MNSCIFKYDFCVLVDEEHKPQQEHSSHTETLVRFLLDEGCRGWYRSRDMLAGEDIRESITSAAVESEYVIYMLQNNASEDFLNEITIMHNIPARKDRVIIVEDGTLFPDDETDTSFVLSITEIISTSDPEWKHKVLKRLTTTTIDKEFVRFYRKMPYNFYSPIHQLFKQEHMTTKSLPQTVSVIESSRTLVNKENRELIELLGEILKESDDAGARIFVEGQAGMGKTWMMWSLAKEWADAYNAESENTSILTKFNQVYFIPVREIESHSANIERIICHDLKMLGPHFLKSDVQRQIKLNDKRSLFLIDGIDEMKINEEKESDNITIDNIIKGDIAPKATVIVTMRSCSKSVIKYYLKDNQTFFNVAIDKLKLECIQKHLQSECPDIRLDDLVKDSLEDTMMGKPLFLLLQCYIWKCRKRNAENAGSTRTYNTETSVLDALWGIMLGVKDDKEGRSDKLIFYESLRDDKLLADVKCLVETLAKLAYSMIDAPNCSGFIHRPSFIATLGHIGIIDVHGTRGQFVHNIFLEHCAALHVLIGLHQSHQLDNFFLSEHLPEVNILKYAVGMEPNILKDIATQMCTPLECVAVDNNFLCDVDLQFEEEILMECQDKEIAKHYGKTLTMQPIKTESCSIDRWVDNKRVISRSADVIRLIGREACSIILQAANPSLVAMIENNHVIQVPTNWDGKFEVSSPMMLASLYSMNISQIVPLHLYNVDQDVLQLTREWTIKGTKWYELEEIHIMRPVKTAQHLKAVLETVVLTDTLRLLTLPCYTATQKTEAKWDTSLNANVSVEKLSIYGKYSLRDLTTLIAQLKKVTICCLDASNVEHVDYDRIDGITKTGLSMVELIGIGNTPKFYILLKWLSDITGGHLSKLEITKADSKQEYDDSQNYDVLSLKIGTLAVPQALCLDTPLLEWIDVGRLDCWKKSASDSDLCVACPVSVSMRRLYLLLRFLNKSSRCFNFSINTSCLLEGELLNMKKNIALDGLHIVANTAVTTEFADLLFNTLKLRPSKFILTIPYPSALVKEDGFNLLRMYPSLTERLREFYVENGRLSLELISDFLQLHRRHNKDTGGKWEKITIATGTNIAVEAKIDIEEKIVINVLEIQTRMTWQCLISLLRICQVDTLYLHLDVYHGSFEQRDISVDMPNTKVVLGGLSAAAREARNRSSYRYKCVLNNVPADSTGTMFLWLRGMTITNAREVQIPEDTSTEDKGDVERCFGRETPITYLNEKCRINTRYPLTEQPAQQDLCTIS